MHHVLLQLIAFHQAMRQPVGPRWTPDVRVDVALRVRLIAEEFGELLVALKVAGPSEVELLTSRIEDWVSAEKREWVSDESCLANSSADQAAVLDALCDLIYVTVGAAVTWGLPLSTAWEEVHRVNMTKSTGPIREDGKRLKPEGFQPPNMADVLELARLVDVSGSRLAAFYGATNLRALDEHHWRQIVKGLTTAADNDDKLSTYDVQEALYPDAPKRVLYLIGPVKGLVVVDPDGQKYRLVPIEKP